MVEFTFTLQDEDVTRLVEGLCLPRGLEPTIENTRTLAIEAIQIKVQDYERIEAEKALAAAITPIEIV